MLKTIAIAGTFDRLHKGHRYFIRQAFRLGYKVIIGLTSDYYVEVKFKIQNSKFKINVNNYEARKKELEEFLTQEKLLDRAEIVKIDDVYGPAIKKSQIEALVVTRETLEGAGKVNKRRKELGLKSLKILQVPLIAAEDKKRLASTRIRVGEIDRYGKVFAKQMQISNIKYQISNRLRQELKKPLGELLRGDPDNLRKISAELKNYIRRIHPVMIITVGDEVTRVCNEIGIKINLAIVDFRVHRMEKYHSLMELGFTSSVIPSERSESRDPSRMRARMSREIPRFTRNDIIEVKNPPGHITKELVEAVRNTYLGIIRDGKQRIIQVDGEEDLAGVPAVLMAPLGSIVLYGQPQQGVVVVEVTEESKEKILSLINLLN